MSAHVAILMGGWSAEREVSLTSGASVERALRDEGYRVTAVDVKQDLASRLVEIAPDVAFNALHGRFGEDGCVQGLLEVMGLPYTHSGVLASALAMNKPVAKRLFQDAGLRCPEGRVMARTEVCGGAAGAAPYVVKPLSEGSSVGVRVVFDADNAVSLNGDWTYGEEVLVERYIPGREIQVAVMGERALGAIEIRPRARFFDYRSKYTEDGAEHRMPAPIHADAYEEALDIALTAHRTLGCRGVTRADLRYDETEGAHGEFYLLEINTQPGLTPISLVPEIAADAGIGFGALVRWLVENARCDG